MRNHITAIVKPTHDCNLSCKYCYVGKTAENGRMDTRTVTKIITEIDRLFGGGHIIWHGGEPLLMGQDFFEEVANISKSVNNRVTNSIQSNATLITDKFLDFMEKEGDFQLGLSLDGPKDITDQTRVYPNGDSAFDDIFLGFQKVRARRDPSGEVRRGHLGGGAIVVLSQANINRIEEVYQFFKNERISIKVNPLIEADFKFPRFSDLKITPREYADAMIRLFNLWIDDESATEIDPFSIIMGNLMTEKPIGCNYSSSCRKNFISIGPQGDIYPCGRFDGIKAFWMGSINRSNGLENALNSDIHQKLSTRKKETLENCSKCEYGDVCNGGCMHNALTAGNVMGKDPYCAGYKRIFDHVQGRLHQELAMAEATT